MIPALWNGTIFGGIAMTTEDYFITAPRFGDGNWRGGWWASYDLRSGSIKWRREHRRGAALFDRIDDVAFATTHKYSGVYAISLKSGRRLWARLGDRFDWMLKCFDLLPCDNEGDAPERVWNGGLLTRSGRLLDAKTGRIVSCHQLEYSKGNPRTLVKIDGRSVSSASTLRAREAIDLHKQESEIISALLAKDGLGFPGWGTCMVSADKLAVSIACAVPREFLDDPRRRIAVGGSAEEVPHYLVVCDAEGPTILKRYELGSFYTGELDWVDDTVLSVTTQTRRQWSWSYQRQMWLLEWRTLREMLPKR